MNIATLTTEILTKKSYLCVGLDTDITKIPQHLLTEKDPVFAFNQQIIDATKEYCVSFKPNMAFYETQGAAGWISLEKTIQYINQTCPDIFTIADAKRGDIGNTSKMYAKAFLEKLNFDSITVAPYMGEDSVKPFLEYKNKKKVIQKKDELPSSPNEADALAFAIELLRRKGFHASVQTPQKHQAAAALHQEAIEQDFDSGDTYSTSMEDDYVGVEADWE